MQLISILFRNNKSTIWARHVTEVTSCGQGENCTSPLECDMQITCYILLFYYYFELQSCREQNENMATYYIYCFFFLQNMLGIGHHFKNDWEDSRVIVVHGNRMYNLSFEMVNCLWNWRKWRVIGGDQFSLKNVLKYIRSAINERLLDIYLGELLYASLYYRWWMLDVSIWTMD